MDLGTRQVKSITVLKQVIRADGTREEIEVAAYMSDDPEDMEAVLNGEKLPETAPEVGEARPVEGRVTAGTAALSILNSADLETAERIAKLNERRGR